MIRHISAGRLARIAAAAAFLAAAASLPNAGARAYEQLAAVSQVDLFGSTEVHSSNLKMFPKWRGTLQRFEEELKSCGSGQCKKKQWQAVIDGLRGKDVMTQLREINTEMNDKRYITDPVNWNLPDYWATPFQFLRKNGDCEDYAISKYMALRDLGVAVEDMRIVVLNDLNLRIAHAVLAVYVNGKPYILDNQISKVVPASSIRHYQPVYSINEGGWWLHRS
jgi:predicted transglutaminase-like cysteine proteinase